MASTRPGRPAAYWGLGLALLVLVLGVLALSRNDDDDGPSVGTGTTTTSRPVVPTAPVPLTPGSSTTIAAGPSTTVDPTSTTVPPPARSPSPDDAARGLWEAYVRNDTNAATGFASREVVQVLFSVPYAPPEGEFKGCSPDGDAFLCRYTQPTAEYKMTVQRLNDGDHVVAVISVTQFPAASTTTTTAPTSTTILSSTTTTTTPTPFTLFPN